MLADAVGMFCTVLALTSQALLLNSGGGGGGGLIEVEFTTPRATPVDGALLCFAGAAGGLTMDNATLSEVIEGGDQWRDGDSVWSLERGFEGRFAPRADLAAFLPSPSPMTLTNLGTVLATDPFFAASYTHTRYDDLIRDGFGPIGGLDGYHVRVPASHRDGVDADLRCLHMPACLVCLSVWDGCFAGRERGRQGGGGDRESEEDTQRCR